MSRFRDLNLEAFRANVTASQVRGLQIIPAALCGSVVLFAGVLFFLAGTHAASPRQAALDAAAVATVRFLTLAHFLLAAIVYGAAPRVENAVYRRGREIQGENSAALLTAQALGIIQTARLTRLAMYEGVALMGLVVCFIAMSTNVMAAHPVYWVNAITAALLIGYVVSTFPNRDRLAEVFQARLQHVT